VYVVRAKGLYRYVVDIYLVLPPFHGLD